jgi:hypothetical protein
MKTARALGRAVAPHQIAPSAKSIECRRSSLAPPVELELLP